MMPGLSSNRYLTRVTKMPIGKDTRSSMSDRNFDEWFQIGLMNGWLTKVHSQEQYENDPEGYWGCAAHAEDRGCCADNHDVWRVSL